MVYDMIYLIYLIFPMCATATESDPCQPRPFLPPRPADVVFRCAWRLPKLRQQPKHRQKQKVLTLPLTHHQLPQENLIPLEADLEPSDTCSRNALCLVMHTLGRSDHDLICSRAFAAGRSLVGAI